MLRSLRLSTVVAVLVLATDAAHADDTTPDDTTGTSAPANEAIGTPRGPTDDAPPAGMVFDPTTGRYMPVAEPLPWRNTFVVFDTSVTQNTLDTGDAFNNSYLVQSLSLRPRWNFTNTLSVRLRQDIFMEWVRTVPEAETQPFVLDTQLDLVEASIATIEGVIIGVGGRVLLPVSQISQSANRVLATGGFGAATRVFGDVMAGLITQVSGGYQRWWSTSDVPTGYAPQHFCTVEGVAQSCDVFAVPSAFRDQFTAGLAAQLNITPEFSVGAGLSWFWQLAPALSSATIDVPSAEPWSIDDHSRTHWRNFTSSSLYTAYQVNSWLQLYLSLNSLTTQLNPDGSLRNPFWNNQSQISFTALITVDQLYTSLRDATTSETAMALGRTAPQPQ